MRIRYFVSETFTNLKRNLLMTVAAVSTVAISLLLLGGSVLLGKIVNNVTGTWEAKVEISTFLRSDATQGEIQALQTDVSRMPEVQAVTFVSKDQAFEEFKQLYKNNPEFWQTLPEDSLPASLRIKLVDAEDTEEIAARIKGAPGVDDVNYGGGIIKRLIQVNSLLSSISLGIALVLGIAAAALIANTIRLAIYARREEIGIMKLVGATNTFIRVPFMLEGVIAALAGALLSSGVVLGANELVFKRMGNFLQFLGPAFSFSTSDMIGVLVILIGLGALVGLVGSFVALHRFLEV